MWLWFVLGAILVGIAWALKATLEAPTLYPIIATVAVVTLLLIVWGLRWWLALRAAQKLQEVIENQGSQQAMNARPERRAEIQELRKQLLTGLGALKTSKLGRGGKRGGAALYTMPWYMIIGPPGAGKTTALTHSGLVFPYGGTRSGTGGGGGVRGVGGTRNCDWWFTNEAILLDTAGRYTTESDDRDEWLSFLNFLRRYRPKRPINGIIIAISILELIDANEMQIEATGKKLRDRIDEVASQLHMVLPVYLLFTKIDLVAGFSEFFGDMRKSDRSKCWGATIKLELPKNEPARIFGAEFDILVKQLHSRGLKRLVMERGREVREKLYQFPLEFAGLKKNLGDLIATTFQPNTVQGTPIFRGFYFTSGTQEGRPMDRVLERMSAAMGIRAQQAQQAQQPVVESKSYFLHDVFMTIIFPDGDIAVRSAVEERRQMLMKVIISVATFVLAAVLAVPGFTSYRNNKKFVAESETAAKGMAALNWEDGTEPIERVKYMDDTLRQLQENDKFDKSVPLTMGWGMFVADKVKKPTLKVYQHQMQASFVTTCKAALETQLNTATGGPRFLEDWIGLRMYLMLSSIDNKMDHLDVDWATGRFTKLWANQIKKSPQGSASSEIELKRQLRPHVHYYFEKMKAGKIPPIKLQDETIQRVRGVLQTTPLDKRYYDLFVRWLTDELIDEAGDEKAFSNRVFPPIVLRDAFPARTTEIMTQIFSKKYKAWKDANGGKLGEGESDEDKYRSVPGTYSAKGYLAVIRQMQNAEGLLKSEAWVVPLTAAETPENIALYVGKTKEQYENDYILQWVEFFGDIKVRAPEGGIDAINIYRELSENPSPLKKLIELLDFNTQWRSEDLLVEGDGAQERYGRFLSRIERYAKLVAPSPALTELGKKTDKIPAKFKGTAMFGQAGGADIKEFKYTDGIVKPLKNELIKIQNGTGGKDFPLSEARAAIEKGNADAAALVNGCDATCQQLLKPLLLDPLVVTSPVVAPPGVDPGTTTAPAKGKNPPIHTKKLPQYPWRNP